MRSNHYVQEKRTLSRRGGCCSVPSCSATLDLTVDHIVPRLFFKMLGMESFADTEPENFQFLCKKHNSEKDNMLDYTNPKTLPIVRKYMNMWIEKHADYFVPIEKRVFKLGVRCVCNGQHQQPELDTVKWKKQIVVIPKTQKIDNDDW